MCGRYLTPDQAAFERYWGTVAPPDFRQSFNVAPSQLAPVLRRDSNGLTVATLMIWGFQPGWAKRGWINARAETVFETRAFARAALRHRCLVPAMGWYEWQGDKAPKQPYVLHRDGFVPIAFAGLWTARQIDGAWQHSYAIVTRQAHEAIRDLHDRMPAVLDGDAAAVWLRPEAEPDALRAALVAPSAPVAAYAVSSQVNKPEHDDPSLIAPVS